MIKWDEGYNNAITSYYSLPSGLWRVLTAPAETTAFFAETDGVENLEDFHRGSVRQILDPAAEVVHAATYDPYGNLYASAGVDSSAFGWAGDQQDENGVVFLRARYYDPTQRRFLDNP